QCLGASAEEVVLLIDDGTDTEVVEGLVRGLEDRDCVPVIARMPRYEVPGSEPPAAVARILEGSSAAIELTSTFIGSSRARQSATASGTRYLCMPGVVADTFRVGGPLDVDFDELRVVTETLSDAWERAD